MTSEQLQEKLTNLAEFGVQLAKGISIDVAFDILTPIGSIKTVYELLKNKEVNSWAN